MTKWSKFISTIIAILIIFSSLSYTFAKTTDYSNNWANREIEKWISIGVAQTNDTGEFKPSDPIRRIDMAILLNRLFNYQEKSTAKFSDIASGASLAVEVAKAVAAGNFTGNGGKFRPNDSITRQEAAVVFARAFCLKTSGKNILGKFKDADKIASWSRDAVNTMVGSGYMNGVPGGLFAPGIGITRAEAIKIMDNMVKDLKNRAGTYKSDINGNLIVNTKNVVLENMTIKGDLYLTEGIGSGEVTLNNVNVTGRTVIKGGGENSIVLNNTSIRGSLVVIKRDGKVRVVASGSSEINNITLNSGARLEESDLSGKGFGNVEVFQIAPGQQVTLDGDFSSLSIDADGVKANIPDGTVGTVKIKEGTSGSKLVIGSTASVKNLVADDDVTITGGSRIESADINSNGVVLDVKPGSIDIAPNITATVAGTSTTGSNTTAPVTAPATPAAVIVPPVTPSTGGGGGGNGGSGNGGGGGNGGGSIYTKPGTLSIYPSKAAIGSTPSDIFLTFIPAESTRNQTVIFNLPDGIRANTHDCFYPSANYISLNSENISNSGKTVTLKNLDLTNGWCMISLRLKTMPSTIAALSFNVSSDSDGDQNGTLPSDKVTASMELVSTIPDLECGANDKSIHVMFTPPAGTGVIFLKYRKVGSSDWREILLPRNLTYLGYDIFGVEPDTTYNVKVQVIGGLNDGESNMVSVHTLKTPPLLSADSPSNQPGNDITLTFADDSAWRNSIDYLQVSSLSTNSPSEKYRIIDSNPSFTVNAGNITIKKEVFKYTGKYVLSVISRDQYMVPFVELWQGPINNFECTSRSDSKAYFKFTALSGASSVKIQQSTDNGSNWVDSVLESPITANSTTAASIALSSNMEYLFKLVVNGGISEGSSNTEKVTTLSNIQNFTPVVWNNRTATFTFPALGNSMSSAVIQLLDGALRWQDAPVQTAITANTTSASISGLNSDTAYQARLYVTGGVNAGSSNQVEFTTNGNIQDLTVTNIEEKSLTLQFSPLGEGTTSAVIEYYSLLNPSIKFYYNIPYLCATTTSASITGLSSDTIYMFRLLTCGGPNYGCSNTMGAKTLITLPITLSASDRTVIAGEITTSRLTVTPTDPYITLHFSSNNTAIASVNASSGLITGVSAGSAVITVTATKTGYGNVSTSFKVTVVDDAVPTIKASVDFLNRITLTFRGAVDKSGTIKVYKADGTSQLGNSIDLTPAIGFVDWESATVVKISNMAGSTSLDNTDAKIIMIKVTGVRDTVTGDVIADKIITLQAADTKRPVICDYYIAKAGDTAENDTVTFYFNEAMDAATLKNLNNYVITTAAGAYNRNTALSSYNSDVSVNSVASDNKSVEIRIKNGKADADAGLAFMVSDLRDMAGNIMIPSNITLLYEGGPYVTTTRAIAVNKIEIEMNQDIKSCNPGTFTVRTGPSSTSPVAAVFISTSIDGKRITAILDRNLTTDCINTYLDILDGNLTKNFYDIGLTTSAGILANGPVAIPDRVKAVVKTFMATTGGIIIEFSEMMTTNAANFITQELVLFRGSDPAIVQETSISVIEGTGLSTGFTKLLLSGLEANRDYTIRLVPKGVTRDKSEYQNWFSASEEKTVTPLP